MLLDKMHKYEMDPTRTVGTTEQTRDAGWTDGRRDGQTDGRSEANIPHHPTKLDLLSSLNERKVLFRIRPLIHADPY